MSTRKKSLSLFLMNISFIVISALLLQVYPNAQEKTDKPPYLDIAERILKKGLQEEGAYAILKKITNVGPRLTGSPQAAAAVRIVFQEMTDLGLDAVHLEPTKVGRWVRGEKENARLVSSQFGSIPLSICAIGGSIPTPETGISAHVVEIHSFQELQAKRKEINGKPQKTKRAKAPDAAAPLPLSLPPLFRHVRRSKPPWHRQMPNSRRCQKPG